MSLLVDRRTCLAMFAALAAAPTRALAEQGLRLSEPRPFSFDGLKDFARARAAEPYAPPRRPAPEIVSQIDYDAWGAIHFNTDDALEADGPGRFPATFFHLGKFFPKSVEMNVVSGGQARTIIYDPSYFDMPEASIARDLPEGAGFAGFRLQEARDGALDWRRNDWVAFLGASYFRAIGDRYQYGLSARGVALDTVMPDRAEEFPDFTRFYITAGGEGPVLVHALLEGPSITGAYQFALTRDAAVRMDVECALWLRRDIGRFGLAPLTSMYWFSETRKPTAVDWRPEVHDSDGLYMWTGKGERIWRPLDNPPHTIVSAFLDENPRGFGLMQRDRDFDHYEDGVFYDRRPSVWVEPLGDWGRGSVQLVENPTDDEIHDNIVAMWTPEGEARAGASYEMRYRLYWQSEAPDPGPLARCVATRLGNGGQPGQPRPQGVRKFVVEFLGGPLAGLPFGVKPDAVLTAARGTFSNVMTEPVPDGQPGHWRAQFDLASEGEAPIDLRCYLRAGDQVLTETWLYSYRPF